MRKLLADPLCRVCLRRATNTHHLIGRGQRGDDDVDNLIPLCGSGSDGCHGALHGTPYTREGRRWTADEVRQTIGLRITSSEYTYVVCKLGAGAAGATLSRLYRVEIATLRPFRMQAARGMVGSRS